MHLTSTLSFLLFHPLIYAWTTTISFKVYIECLEQNPIGLPYGSIIAEFDRSIPLFYSEYTNGQRREDYTWQVYPNPNIAPIRPARPPVYLPQYNPRYLAIGHCTNVPPGTCCRTIAPFITNGQFSNLPPGSISAFWGSNLHTTTVAIGCNERNLDSYYGSPQWAWQDSVFPPRILGASYISCPSNGIDRGWGFLLAGFCSRLKKKGTSSVPPPAAWVWPDLVTVDAVNYTDDRRGDLLYRDTKNGLLNLTRLT